ncbi:hypothetical protein WICMUC_001313 [Wickerhamomyces mucosus]|uniref:Pre-mRNA-splicing factor CWC15 n=1 Tax=Wickerhamomyces mucosus TaxID=1378264 RepID=A0A9P8PWP8_9ASCO|nr:hypothetical protein WICMUC_001313 [Wickerhamomyces mucosus]
MTTNHRPTFESRRGRELEQTSIVHSRQLPAYKQLKFRTGYLNETETRNKYEELKKELLKNDKTLSIKDNEELEQQEESYVEKRRRIALETQDLDKSDSESEGEGGNENENHNGVGDSESEDSEDEDEDAELLKELAKIKEERKQRELAEAIKLETIQNVSSSSLSSSHAKKSWRQSSIFKTHKSSNSKAKNGDNYVNDLIKSDFHKKFMDKYVK